MSKKPLKYPHLRLPVFGHTKSVISSAARNSGLYALPVDKFFNG